MDKYFNKTFNSIILLAAVMEVASLYCIATLAFNTLTYEQSAQLCTQITSMPLSPATIFVNNLLVSFPLVIPFIGVIFFGFTWANTAWVIGAGAKMWNVPPVLMASKVILLAFPEILAYTLLLSENIYIVSSFFAGNMVETVKTHSWKTVVIWVILLFAGACLEAMMVA